METRTKKVKRNVIYATISQITKAVLLFFSRIIFVRILGPEYLGINGLFSNVLTILSLADLGMTTAMMYSLYKPLAEDNKNKIIEYMNFYKKIYNIIAICVLVIGLSLVPFLKYIVNLPSNIDNIYVYYLILLSNTVLSYLFIYKTTLLSADQKLYIINKYDTIIQILQFILQLIILLLTHSFLLYLLVQVFCTLFGNILKVFSTKKIYPYLDSNDNQLPNSEKKSIFKNLKSLFFYKLGSIIQSNTDNILISIFVGTVTVGYYSNYNLIILQIINFITIIFTAIKSSVGNFNIESDCKTKMKMFDRLELFNFVLVGFSSVYLLFLVPDFISLCFGKNYVIDFVCYIFVILNYYTSNIRQTLWVFRETSGIFDKTKYITIVTSVINLVASIILGKIYGLLGIVLATVLARMVYAWWKEPIIIYRDLFKKKSNNYFYKYIVRLALIIIICIVLQIVFNIITFDNLIINLIVKFVVITIVLVFSFLIIYSKTDEFQFFKDKLISKNNKY